MGTDRTWDEGAPALQGMTTIAPALRHWLNLCERYQSLAEGAMPDAVLKAAARHLLRAVDTGYTGRGGVLNVMFEDEYIDSFDGSETRKPGFRTKLRDWCSSSVYNMAWTLGEKLQQGKLPIWRMITAPADWTPDPNRHPGIYWCWDREAAEAHWGNDDNDVKWLLYAEADNQHINWPVTLSKNCMPDYEDEKEIELKNVPIKIISYERND